MRVKNIEMPTKVESITEINRKKLTIYVNSSLHFTKRVKCAARGVWYFFEPIDIEGIPPSCTN